MAIAPKGQGAGVSTETSGAALSPACPATVDAGDILLLHVFWEGTTTAPSPPGDWTLLSGPHVIETTIGRHWLYGKIAAGTEDGAAIACGNPAVTTQRGARIYSYSGRVGGTIAQLVGGFVHGSHATDPQGQSVTTPAAGALACLFIAQNDNNTIGPIAGMSGGTWAETVAEFVAALTPGLLMSAQHCTPTANPGTVSGGTFNTANDPVGVLGFWIRDNVVAHTSNAEPGSYSISGAAATAIKNSNSNAEAGSYSISGAAASAFVAIPSNAEPGAYSITGVDATGTYESGSVNTDSNAEPGAYSINGAPSTAPVAKLSNAEPGAYSISGAAAVAVVAIPSSAGPGVYTISGAEAEGTIEIAPVNTNSIAEPGSYSISGAPTKDHFEVVAEPGDYDLTGAAAEGVIESHAHISSADPGIYIIEGADTYDHYIGDPVISDTGGGGGVSFNILERIRQARMNRQASIMASMMEADEDDL